MTSLTVNATRRRAGSDRDPEPRRPSAAAVQARRAAEARARREQEAARRTRLAIWGRLGLVIVLGAAIVFWPYPAECGVGLYTYLGAESMIVIGGLWVAGCTWRERRPALHGLALLVSLWGLALAGHQILLRTGYVHVYGDSLPAWTCTSPAVSSA